MVRPSSASMAEDPKYRGVRKRKWGKWVSEIRLPNSRERIWLGSYDSPEKAARAFDAALFCLRGNTANFNFPHEPPNIPGGTDLHPSQIQAVAARFANSVTSSPSPSQLSHEDSGTNYPAVSNYQISSSMDVVTSSSSFLEDDYMNNVNNDSHMRADDFEIFPGFDDYFMAPLQYQQQPPPAADYGEEVFDGVYSQDPSFLWNF